MGDEIRLVSVVERLETKPSAWSEQELRGELLLLWTRSLRHTSLPASMTDQLLHELATPGTR